MRSDALRHDPAVDDVAHRADERRHGIDPLQHEERPTDCSSPLRFEEDSDMRNHGSSAADRIGATSRKTHAARSPRGEPEDEGEQAPRRRAAAAARRRASRGSRSDRREQREQHDEGHELHGHDGRGDLLARKARLAVERAVVEQRRRALSSGWLRKIDTTSPMSRKAGTCSGCAGSATLNLTRNMN